MNKINERVKIGMVVDENGIILNELYEGDKIVTKNQDEYRNKYAINYKKGDAFVKVYTNPITAMFKELPTKEFAVAMAIMPFISYKDGILRYNGKIADVKTIGNALGENYETFNRVIASLIKKQVLSKVNRQSDTYANKTKKCLVANPDIFLKGQDIEKSIINEFKGNKWANIIEENN